MHPLDPVETEHVGEPVYAMLNPQLACEDPPPEQVADGMRAVRVDGSWALEASPRIEAQAMSAMDIAPATSIIQPDQPATTWNEVAYEYMDAMARAVGFKSIDSAVTFADEASVPALQHKALALRAWRSAVLQACVDLAAAGSEGTAEPSVLMVAELVPRLAIPPIESVDPAKGNFTGEAVAGSEEDRPAPSIADMPNVGVPPDVTGAGGEVV